MTFFFLSLLAGSFFAFRILRITEFPDELLLHCYYRLTDQRLHSFNQVSSFLPRETHYYDDTHLTFIFLVPLMSGVRPSDVPPVI